GLLWGRNSEWLAWPSPRARAGQCSGIRGPVQSDSEPAASGQSSLTWRKNQRRMSSGDSLDFIVSMCIITHVHTCQEISVIARASLIDLPLPATSRDYKITLLAAIFAPKSS